MKELVLAMACVLGLGMLAASCKQGTQDVNLTNQQKTEATEFRGTAAVSATAKSVTDTTPTATTRNYAFTATTGVSVVATGLKFDAKLTTEKKSDAYDSNVEGAWKLVVPFVRKTTTTNGNVTTITEVPTSATLNFYKIGDKYFFDDGVYSVANATSTSVKSTKEKEVTLGEGQSFDDGKVTINGIGLIKAADDNYYDVASITFTRAGYTE